MVLFRLISYLNARFDKIHLQNTGSLFFSAKSHPQTAIQTDELSIQVRILQDMTGQECKFLRLP